MNDDITSAYREEFIALFQQEQSPLQQSVRAVPPGTVILTEWHDLTRRTNFNLYTSQGDGRRIMQNSTIGGINRKIDSDIITELNSAGNTQDNGAAVTASLSLVMYGMAVLGSNAIPLDGNIFAAVTPAFHAYLMQTREFTSADFVGNAPFSSTPAMYRWAGVNFIVHSRLPGAGTAEEKCFLYHKDAIGHACGVLDAQIEIGVDDETQGDCDNGRKNSWARTSLLSGARLIRPSGVFVMNHNGAGLA